LGPKRDGLGPANAAWKVTEQQYPDACGKCGARRVDSQIGLEATPEAYVAALVGVFREVKRVLRDDGTLWLNIGDSMNSAASNQNGGGAALGGYVRGGNAEKGRSKVIHGAGLKSKDMIGIPWMLAFALRADGWYLRSAAPWVKRSAMPESVTDRPSSSLEYMFLLTKRSTYFYDADGTPGIPRP
jgi:DNA modification methylase